MRVCVCVREREGQGEVGVEGVKADWNVRVRVLNQNVYNCAAELSDYHRPRRTGEVEYKIKAVLPQPFWRAFSAARCTLQVYNDHVYNEFMVTTNIFFYNF